MDQNLLVMIPLDHSALEPLRKYTNKTLNCEGIVLEKSVRIKGRIYKALIPVLVFRYRISAWKHILFTLTLATLRNPQESAELVARAINDIGSEKILEALYITTVERFNEIRGELIAKPDLWHRRIGWITRIGLALRTLYDINIE